MVEASSKRQKAVERDGEGGIDRISGLPDSILCHILSFLPTKTCVSTMSLVSRKWRHLWEHLQVFDFSSDYDDGSDIKLVKRFAFFVNAVLTLRRSRDILKMQLDCVLIEHSEFSVIDFVDLWVRAAIGPRLEELRLMLPTDENCSVVLPHTLLNCSNLVFLSLSGPVNWNVQHSSAQIYFPSLKDLYLAEDSVNSIDALLTCCPTLETLNIMIEVSHFSSLRFRVPPSLKRLKYNCFVDFSTYIDIDAPCLEYLYIDAVETVNTAVGNLQNVVEAYIDMKSYIDSDIAKRLLNLLQAICGTKHLTLCCSTTKKKKPLQIWEPESTRPPNCLVSHLTSIHIKEYRGLEDELTFVEYILRNALVLKTMIIESYISMGLEEKLNFLKKIINIPRGYDLCQVEFD